MSTDIHSRPLIMALLIINANMLVIILALGDILTSLTLPISHKA
jgi:hypothetical protein